MRPILRYSSICLLSLLALHFIYACMYEYYNDDNDNSNNNNKMKRTYNLFLIFKFFF